MREYTVCAWYLALSSPDAYACLKLFLTATELQFPSLQNDESARTLGVLDVDGREKIAYE